MGVLAGGNYVVNSSSTYTGTLALQAACLDGVYLNIVVAQGGASGGSYQFVIQKRVSGANQVLFQLNCPVATNGVVNVPVANYFPFGQNGLVTDDTQQVSITADVATTTGTYRFIYYLYGDYL